MNSAEAEVKQCKKCGLIKPVCEFDWRAKRVSRNCNCKACEKLRRRASDGRMPLGGVKEDLVGKRFTRLTVVECAGLLRGATHWRCRCDCGNIVIALPRELKSGLCQSCGCRRIEIASEASRTHGKSKTREYRIWKNMMRRCHSPKNSSYKWYGAKGITVCERWRESFENFFADMGESPTPKHSIDRKDTSRGYEPGNCWWATTKDQNRNYSRNRLATYEGRTQCLASWAEELGLKYGCFHSRFRRFDGDMERVVRNG